MHHTDGFFWVVAFGSFSGQHHTVCAVKNRVRHIGNFRASRSGIVGHGLKHLSGADDGLAFDVAFRNHHLLSNENFSRWNLDPEITTSDHYTVGFFEDLIKVVQTLLVLNLGDDLDILAVFTEDSSDVLDVFAATDEGCKDHVDSVLYAESQIFLVFLGQSWKVDIGPWEIDAFLGRDLAIIEGSDAERFVVDNLDHFERLDTIVDIDKLACVNDLGDVFVVNVAVSE